MADKKNVSSLRGTLDYLKEQNEVIHIDKEVDPVCKIAGTQKGLDGCPLSFLRTLRVIPI